MKTLNEHDLAIAEHIAYRLDHRYRKVVIAVAVAVLLSVIGVVGGWLIVKHESSVRSDDIQRERAAAALTSCRQTNARNVQTIARLKKLARGSDTSGAQGLINALAPKRDCEKYVKGVVKG